MAAIEGAQGEDLRLSGLQELTAAFSRDTARYPGPLSCDCQQLEIFP